MNAMNDCVTYRFASSDANRNDSLGLRRFRDVSRLPDRAKTDHSRGDWPGAPYSLLTKEEFTGGET